jgi:hypothetical protein
MARYMSSTLATVLPGESQKQASTSEMLERYSSRTIMTITPQELVR